MFNLCIFHNHLGSAMYYVTSAPRDKAGPAVPSNTTVITRLDVLLINRNTDTVDQAGRFSGNSREIRTLKQRDSSVHCTVNNLWIRKIDFMEITYHIGKKESTIYDSWINLRILNLLD